MSDISISYVVHMPDVVTYLFHMSCICRHVNKTIFKFLIPGRYTDHRFRQYILMGWTAAWTNRGFARKRRVPIAQSMNEIAFAICLVSFVVFFHMLDMRVIDICPKYV